MPIWNALPPEINVGSLVGYPPFGIPPPPGAETITFAADSYAASSMAFLEAAARTQAAMLDLGENWGGESGELAQSAFRNHTNWLIQQSQAAQQASTVLYSVADEFKTAQEAMEFVAGLLLENKLEEAFLIATNHGQNMGLLIWNHLAYIGIWGLAAHVLNGYAGAVLPTLSALPPPAVPEPIVTDPGVPPPPPQFEVPVYTPKSRSVQQFGRSTTTNHNTNTNNTNSNTDNTSTNSNTNNTNTNSNTSNTNTGDTNTGNTDTGNAPTDTTQSPTQTQPTVTDPSEVTSPLSDLGSYGTGDGSDAQPGVYGTSFDSPTLAGLNGGGVGSLVALNLALGGLGSMPGASTGFRMPSTWLRGPGAAYGASSNPASTAPAGRAAPRRGAIAPKAQLRRRRRDEERKPGKVFVPGEQLDVPVLEKPPVIGVIEYVDERPEDVVVEGDSLVGILERSDDDERSDDAAAVAEPEPAR